MGFILTNDIVHIREDPTNQFKFTIYAQKRTLELESKSLIIRTKWIRALRFLIEFKKNR